MKQDQALHSANQSDIELRAWRTRTLNIVLIAVAVVVPPALYSVISDAFSKPEQQPAAAAFVLCYLAALVMAIFQRIDPRLRAWGLLIVGYGAGILAFMRGGLAGDGRVYIMALPPIAFILIGFRTGLATSILSGSIFCIFAYLADSGQMNHWLIPRFQSKNSLSLYDWTQAGLVLAITMIPVTLLLWRFIRFQEKTLDAARVASLQLAETSTLLRQQAQEREENTHLLAERSEALSMAAEVAHQIASLTSEQELIDRFVNLIGERFHLYHVGIFLPDAQRENLVLRAASSEGGRQMIREGYQLAANAGELVAQAAQNLAPSSAATRAIQTLPQLPKSQWQVSLPLQAGRNVLAVLDIHFSDSQSPPQEQIGVLRTLAAQLAVGLQNARLFAQTQASLEELTGVYRSMTADAWQQFIRTKPGLNRYQAGESQLSEQAWQALLAQTKAQGQPVSAQGEAQHLLAVPIKLRGVPIGAIGFHRPEQAGEWQPDEIALAERVAERAAIALENVRLVKDARQRAAREQLLSAVTARVRSGLTLEQVLNNTVRQVGQTMGAARVAVQLHLPDEQNPLS